LLSLHVLRRLAGRPAGDAPVPDTVPLARAVVLARFTRAAAGAARRSPPRDAERPLPVRRHPPAHADSLGPVSAPRDVAVVCLVLDKPAIHLIPQPFPQPPPRDGEGEKDKVL